MKTILHITVGGPGWDPSAEELANIRDLFQGVSLGKEDATVVTRQGITLKVIDVEEGAEVKVVRAIAAPEVVEPAIPYPIVEDTPIVLRTVKRRVGDSWETILLKDLVVGDTFKQENPDGTLYVDDTGHSLFGVLEAPREYDGVWGVECAKHSTDEEIAHLTMRHAQAQADSNPL